MLNAMANRQCVHIIFTQHQSKSPPPAYQHSAIYRPDAPNQQCQSTGDDNIRNYKRNITTTIKIKCDVHHCQQLWNKSICTRVQREAKPKPSLIKQHHTDSVSCWNSNRPATTCARASQLTVCVNLYLILNTTNCKIFCGACLKGQSNLHAVNTTVTDL